MLPRLKPSEKPLRLKKRADFLRVKETGRSASSPGLVLQAASLAAVDASEMLRYGLTASRRVGGAVERNRARRRLRVLAERLLPLHARPGHDYVLIARAATVDRNFALLEADLFAALKRLRCLNDSAPAKETNP